MTRESKVRWCKGRKGKYWSPADKESILLTKNQSIMNSLWIHYEYTMNTISHQMHEASAGKFGTWAFLCVICQPWGHSAPQETANCTANEKTFANFHSGHCKTETAKCPQNEHFFCTFLAIKDRVKFGSSKTLICSVKGGRDIREERQSDASCNQLAETRWEHFIKKGTRKICEMKG